MNGERESSVGGDKCGGDDGGDVVDGLELSRMVVCLGRSDRDISKTGWASVK